MRIVVDDIDSLSAQDWGRLYKKMVKPLFSLLGNRPSGVLANYMLRGVRMVMLTGGTDVRAVYEVTKNTGANWQVVESEDKFHLFKNACRYYYMWELLDGKRRKYIKEQRKKRYIK